MSWLKIIFHAGKNLPALELACEQLSYFAISYFDALDQPILEPEPGETPMWDNVRVEVLFPASSCVRTITQTLWEVDSSLEIFYSDIAEQNWQNAWMKHFEAKHYEHFSVYPEDNRAQAKSNDVVLVPGLAFGTGNHETTHMCLEWLDQQQVSNLDVIDYGCGSGILAIAAKKLGAKTVWAIDYDEQALLSTQNNAELNHLDQDAILELKPEDFSSSMQADILLANILANPLMELVETFKQHLRPKGRFVLSGILVDQLEDVKKVYAKHFINLEAKTMGDWAALWGQKDD